MLHFGELDSAIPSSRSRRSSRSPPEVEVHVRGRPARVQPRRSQLVPCAVGRDRPRTHARLLRATASGRDHRLPRPLHHRATATRPVPRRPEGGCATIPVTSARRARSRSPTTSSATASSATSCVQRSADSTSPVLTAGELDGAPRRQRAHLRFWSRALQRPDPADLRPLPDNFAPVCQLPQSPEPRSTRRCASSALREEMGFVGCNLNPDPSGGYWNGPTLADRAVLAALRGAVRARRAGDDPRQRDLQPALPHHRLALPRAGHDGLHAGDDVGLFRDSRRCGG